MSHFPILLGPLSSVMAKRPARAPLIARDEDGGVLTTRSFQHVVERAALETGLVGRVSCHTLGPVRKQPLHSAAAASPIPASLVGHMSADMLPPRSSASGRIDALGATRLFPDGP